MPSVGFSRESENIFPAAVSTSAGQASVAPEAMPTSSGWLFHVPNKIPIPPQFAARVRCKIGEVFNVKLSNEPGAARRPNERARPNRGPRRRPRNGFITVCQPASKSGGQHQTVMLPSV